MSLFPYITFAAVTLSLIVGWGLAFRWKAQRDAFQAAASRHAALVITLRAQAEGMKAQILRLQSTGPVTGTPVPARPEEVLAEGDRAFMIGSEKLVDKDGFAGTVLEFKPTQAM